MRDRFFVIWGGQSQETDKEMVALSALSGTESDADMLKKSPCLTCELFVSGTACPHSSACSKIDQFQRIATACRSLYRPHDICSMT